MLTHSAGKESQAQKKKRKKQRNPVCPCVCVRARPSPRPPDCRSLSSSIGALSAGSLERTDGRRDADNGGKDITRFDSAISGMSRCMHVLCPPLDTEDKMSTQTGAGPLRAVGRVSLGDVIFRVVPAKGGKESEAEEGVVSLERSSVRARSGQETFTALCARNIVSCQVFSVCPSPERPV